MKKRLKSLIVLILFAIFPFAFEKQPALNLQMFSGFYPHNPLLGQKMQTGVEGLTVDAAFSAHYHIDAANAVATSNVAVLAATALAAITQEIDENITNPGTPRNIIVKGNQAGVAGNVTIHGTNINNEVISEVIALNGATAVVGDKAFKTVTQIDLPVEVNVGTDTVSVGFGDKLGIPYELPCNTVLFASLDNTREGTAPTVTVSATAFESNTVDLNSALNGKDVDIYLLV